MVQILMRHLLVIVDQLSGAMYCIAIHDIISRVLSLSHCASQ